MRITDRACLAAAAVALATPAAAMDDQATYWRFDGRAEKRISGVAPATEWAASAWIGDDSTKLRLYNSGIVGDSGHIDNEGGTKGIDSRFFYSRLISDFWDAKAGVSFTVFDEGVTRSGFMAGVEGLAPYGIHIDAVLGISQTGVVSARLDAEADRPALPRGHGGLAERSRHPARQRPVAFRAGLAASLRDHQGVRALCRCELRAVHREHRGLRRRGRRADVAGAGTGRPEILVLRRTS
jgi:hypothetical protein